MRVVAQLTVPVANENESRQPIIDHMTEKQDYPNSAPAKSDDDMVYDSVTEADLDESLLMLKTRAGQVNAVFACFGSAAQRAQHFEAALAEFLLEYNKLTRRTIMPEEFEQLDQKLQKRTLGALLREFSKHVRISDNKVVGFLETALEKGTF